LLAWVSDDEMLLQIEPSSSVPRPEIYGTTPVRRGATVSETDW
jgi:hypothetical protein